VIVQNRNATRNRSLDLLLKKDAEFDGGRMRTTRAQAAKALRAGVKSDATIDGILDFMESVAALVKSGDLDETQAWSTFYHWFANYYQACKGIVDAERAKDITVWQDLVWFHARLEAMQLRHARLINHFTPQDIDHFLEQEEAVNP